jgi:TP901 family phage tail tape measure protein
MSDNPLSSKVVFDTTDFKAGVAELNRQIRVMESGFRAAAAGMGDWEQSSAGLEARIKSLGDEIGLQRQKVEGLQGVYDKLASSGTASAKELQELQIRINKETETLNKMQGELGQSEKSLGEMGDEANRAGNEMDELGDKSGEAGNKLEGLKKVAAGLGGALKIGAATVAGIATAAAAAGAAIGGLVMKSAEMAGELVDTANQTGIGVERLQELAYIGKQVGVSTETITGSLSKLTRAMDGARAGTGAQAEAFQKLGIHVTDAKGNLRDSQAVFQESLRALGGVANETERDALAMAIFGKSAMELNPLIKTSASEMKAMTDEAHKLGAVMSEEDVSSLEAFGDTLEALKSGLQGTLGTLATAFLPAFQGIADTAKTYLGQFSQIVKGSNGDLGKMAEGIGGLLGKIANDIASQAPKMLQAGLGILQGIINAIVTNLPTLLPAAIQMITSLVQFLVTNLPLLVDAGIQIVMALVDGVLPMLPMLVDAALKMVITLATGIAEALPELIPAVVAIIPQIIQVLIDNLPLLIDAATQLILGLATGLTTALPILIEAIPPLVEALVSALIQSAPLLIVAASQLILVLAGALVQNLPLLLNAVVQLIEGIVRAFTSANWSQIGSQIVNGIKDGFNSLWGSFVASITRNAENLVKSVKRVLGIRSPSKVFAGIGENMALGLGAGFDGAFGKISNQVNQLVNGLGPLSLQANQLQPAAAASGPVTVNMPVNQVSNNVDIYRLAQQVAIELQKGRR